MGMRFVDCPKCRKPFDVARWKGCLKSLLSGEEQLIRCSECGEFFRFRLVTVDLNEIVISARDLLDFIEMAHPDQQLIWSGDRRTKVVDLPHFKEAKRCIDVARVSKRLHFSFLECLPGAMPRTAQGQKNNR